MNVRGCRCRAEGAKRRQRFLVPKTSALGKTRMGVRLLRPPPNTLKFLLFSDGFTYYVIASCYKLSNSGECHRELNPRASIPLMRVKVPSPV